MATKINKNKVIAAAQKYDQKRQYDKAIKEYAKIVEEDPRDVRIWLKIGDLHAKKNAPDQAIETYSKVAEFYSEQGFYLKAVAVYKQILKLNTNLVEMNLRLAELYKQLGLLSDAMQQYEHVSNFYHREGRTKEALTALRQIVDLDPENVASRIKLAELYSKENMRVEAVEEFSKAGDYLRAENRFDDFVKVGERLIYHQPDNLPLTKELAGIYLRKRDPRRALQKLQLAFKADARDEETLEMLAQAFEDLAQVPKTISVLKELARIHKENGQDKKRIATYERIASLAPQDEEARKVLAEAGPQARHYEPEISSGMDGGYPPAPPPLAPAEPSVAQGGLKEPAYSYEGNGYEGYHHKDSASYVDSGSQFSYDDPCTAEAASRLPTEQGEPPAAVATTRPDSPAQLAAAGAGSPSFDEIAKILTEADVYIKYGLHDKAVEHLRQVFSRDPYNAKVHLKLKDLYLQLARYREAAEEMIFLGGANLQTDPQLAADLLQQALDLDPENSQARELLASLPGGAPPPLLPYSEDALSEVEPIDLDSDDIVEEIPIDSADIVLSEPPLAEGQHPLLAPQDAFELPADYGEDFQEDYSTSGFAQRRGAGPSGVLELRGETTNTLGGGVPSSEVIQLGVDHPPSAAQLRAHQEEETSGIEDDLEEAEFFIQQNLFSEARSILSDLFAQHPQNQLVAAKLADLDALELKPPTEAAEETQHDEMTSDLARELAAEFDDLDAVEIAPEVDAYSVEDVFKEFKRGVNNQISDEDSDTHYDLGIAYREMGLMDDAIAEFKIAMRTREKEVLCHMMIGLCYMEKELASEAISQFKTGLYVEGISERETIALYFELGQSYEQLDDLREALYYYEKVAKKDTRFRDAGSRVTRLRKLTGEDEPDLGGGPGDSPDMLNKVV